MAGIEETLKRVTVRSKGKGEIRARVFRIATGQWEDLGVISSSKLVWRIKKWLGRLICQT